ncbi:MAG: class F sortase [Dehalococcoidia bacterium]
MRRTLRNAGLPVAALALAGVVLAANLDRGSAAAKPRSYEDQLRYVGRDYLTGGPRTVDDGFIAQVERDVERYGKDEREAVPPPPVESADVAMLRIPVLGVAARVGRYGLDAFGRLDVPQDNRTIGWNPGFTSLPGGGRSTFFAAHFEYAGTPGVFFKLSTLKPGDVVEAMLSDGTLARYRVTSTVDYDLAVIDMGALLAGREGVESAVLMTCSGPKEDGEYQLRTVVLADRVE